MFTRNEQALDQFDQIERSHRSDFFSPKRPILRHACATCSELPSNIGTMDRAEYSLDSKIHNKRLQQAL